MFSTSIEWIVASNAMSTTEAATRLEQIRQAWRDAVSHAAVGDDRAGPAEQLRRGPITGSGRCCVR